MANISSNGKESVQGYRDRIETILRKAGRSPMADRDLALKCKTNQRGAANFRTAVNELIKEGIICERRRGYVLSVLMGYFTAKIVRVSRTFGFARPEYPENAPDVFIPGKFLQGALVGDRVLVGEIPSRSGKPEGEVLTILEECSGRFAGIIAEDGGRVYFRADAMAKCFFSIKRAESVNYNVGEKVLAQFIARGERHADHRVKIIFSFGAASRADVCAQSIVAINDARVEFPEDVLENAKKVSEGGISAAEIEKRLDLRETPLLTIDNASSKDLDDAVSLEKTATGYRLGVHIADVSHYVVENSPLDKEALARGTSIYYANRVIPMLPESLSNGICSLNPNEDRLAFSALMDLNSHGEIVHYEFHKSVIRSAVKGVYGEVNTILDDTASADIQEKYARVKDVILTMNELCDKRLEAQKKRGAPELETQEGKMILNDDGVCVDVQLIERGKSECMIEEMMLLANEAAARLAREAKLPFVYRIHEKPSSEKIENLEKVLIRLGLEVPKMDDILPEHLSAILEEVRGTDLFPVMNVMVLRSMSKAAYSPEPIGHFGLALRDYAHFTSPIRRYPDLAIHRIMSAYLESHDVAVLKRKYTDFVAEASEKSSSAEITAVSIERNCADCYKAEYMASHLGEEFTGIVAGVVDFGFYVALPNTVEGLVHVASLPESDWINDEGIAYREELGTSCYRLGDTVRVQCTKVDINSGNVDFVLV